MAATTLQIGVYAYYLSTYVIKRNRVKDTASQTVNEVQSDIYYLENEPDTKSFTGSEIFTTKGALITYLTNQTNALI